jgi:pimeloyl-ACP methyl ester carboxylesterase
MTSSYSWRYVLEPLGRRFRLYCPDLPGAGATSKPRANYSAANTARWIGAFQEAVGIRGCVTIGNSLGGYVCMQLALQDPGAMSRLVNLHSPGFPELRLWALRVLLSIPGVQALLARVVRIDPVRWAHRNIHYFDESLKSLEEARTYAEPLSTPDGAAAFARILRDSVDPAEMKRFQTALAGLDGFPIPLMLLYAQRDPMVPASFGPRFAAAIPDAEFVTLEEASHFAHVDATAAFVQAVTPFLTKGLGSD